MQTTAPRAGAALATIVALAMAYTGFSVHRTARAMLAHAANPAAVCDAPIARCTSADDCAAQVQPCADALALRRAMLAQ